MPPSARLSEPIVAHERELAQQTSPELNRLVIWIDENELTYAFRPLVHKRGDKVQSIEKISMNVSSFDREACGVQKVVCSNPYYFLGISHTAMDKSSGSGLCNSSVASRRTAYIAACIRLRNPCPCWLSSTDLESKGGNFSKVSFGICMTGVT